MTTPRETNKIKGQKEMFYKGKAPCLKKGKWINIQWYIRTMEYSPLKRNEVSNHEKTWRKLKCILLSERIQFEKATYCIIPTV